MRFQVIKVTSQAPQVVIKSEKDSQRSPEKCLAMASLIQTPRLSPPPGEQNISLIFHRFNSSKIPRQDATLHAVSRRYGKETQMDTSPNYKQVGWTTNFRSTITSPLSLAKGNWRTRQPSVTLDQDSKIANKNDRFYNSSGFSQNSMICDGKLFVTEKSMHTDIIRTAYRNQFNQDKPFHKTAAKLNFGKLNKVEKVYDVSDK